MKNSNNQMKKNATDIFLTGLEAADPVHAILTHVKFKNHILYIDKTKFNLKNYKRVIVIGAGKAAASMAKAIEDLILDYISDGIIIVKDGHKLPLKKIKVYEAGHPVPDQRGISGTNQIINLIKDANESDLVLCLISGGGSSLLINPSDGISLNDKQETTKHLLACGASIHEINTVRKHLSNVKGGRLAFHIYPATLISLILSDVVGDNLDIIASGPNVPDSSTFDNTKQILKNHNIWNKIPISVKNHINNGISGKTDETPKSGNIIFSKSLNILVGSNFNSLTAAAKKAEQLGYTTLILTSKAEGEAKEIAVFYAAIAKEIISSGNPLKPPACILSGGETTVTIKGLGKGGRNMEFTLAAAIALKGIHNIIALCGGTDGTDGPTDATGAIADHTTLYRAETLKIDPVHFLNENNSYEFFKKLNDLIITGPTLTNVMDIYMLLIN